MITENADCIVVEYAENVVFHGYNFPINGVNCVNYRAINSMLCCKDIYFN